MDKILKLESVTQFNSKRGQDTLHPLVSVLDQSKSTSITSNRYLSELYIIFLKDVHCEDMKYGRSHYDYQEETLIFVAPNQTFGFDLPEKTLIQPNGWALVFHPDFIRGTALGRRIQDYHFFSYGVQEALHISKREKSIIIECFNKIQYELEQSIDKHSKSLIINNIEMVLNYSVRFYDRQFITRENANKDILTKFEQLLNEYFQSEKPQNIGLPSVGYCAEQFNLSANYFGDLVKKEIGISVQEYIHNKIIDLAKQRVFEKNKSISEIAYELGFKYPQYFTRLFKQKVGFTPNEYRIISAPR